MAAGIFFMVISGLHWRFKWQALSLNQEVLAEYASQEVEGAEWRPVHIEIPWFVNVSISQQVLIAGEWTIAENEASHLANSARPGEAGNIIIYGHNTRAILGNIRALRGGEIITLRSANGTEHRYQVKEIVEVNPDQIEYLLPTNEEVLTIYTCSGFMDKMRFVVRGERVE